MIVKYPISIALAKHSNANQRVHMAFTNIQREGPHSDHHLARVRKATRQIHHVREEYGRLHKQSDANDGDDADGGDDGDDANDHANNEDDDDDDDPPGTALPNIQAPNKECTWLEATSDPNGGLQPTRQLRRIMRPWTCSDPAELAEVAT